LIYFIDFDGTMIPDIPFEDDEQFFKATMDAPALMAPDEHFFVGHGIKWCILTDRPEDGCATVHAWALQNGFKDPVVLSSYGPTFTIPSTLSKIIFRKACIMFMNAWNFSNNELFEASYVDSNGDLESKVNHTYRNIILKEYYREKFECVE